jgi:hypothetical protein
MLSVYDSVFVSADVLAGGVDFWLKCTYVVPLFFSYTHYTQLHRKSNLLTHFFRKFFFLYTDFAKNGIICFFHGIKFVVFLQIPELQPVLDEFGNTIPDKGGRTELQIKYITLRNKGKV